ncbi:hypothetical protein [Pseudomonas luteola]|uniref:hypothetical protein n=1 Tax=Pseudomonas luteola TaxID=47886 RepID=UPI00289B6500|nr:hypothetical protein [Pseudomonas luteola]
MFEVYPTNPELREVSKYTVGTKIAYLRSSFKKIEEVFRQEYDSLLREAKIEDERTKDHEDDSQYNYWAWDSLREIEFIYLRMHRYSAVLAAYSFLESSMNKICTMLEKKHGFQVSVGDLSGDGITRCRLYLNKFAKIDFDLISSDWSSLVVLNKIRNCIVHCDGNAELFKNSEGFIKIIESRRDLSFIEKKMVMVSEEFIYKSINSVENTLIYLVESSKLPK